MRFSLFQSVSELTQLRQLHCHISSRRDVVNLYINCKTLTNLEDLQALSGCEHKSNLVSQSFLYEYFVVALFDSWQGWLYFDLRVSALTKLSTFGTCVGTRDTLLEYLSIEFCRFLYFLLHAVNSFVGYRSCHSSLSSCTSRMT